MMGHSRNPGPKALAICAALFALWCLWSYWPVLAKWMGWA